MRKLIIIPAFNEEEAIEGVVANLTPYLDEYDYVIINDASRDSTLSILERNNYNHINMPLNLGIGGVVQTGYKYALDNDYDIAIQIDGDGQHDPGFLHDMTAPIEAGECDIVIGSRFIDRKGFQSTWIRRLGIDILNVLIRITTGIKVTDATSGYRAVNRRMIELYSKHYPQDYPEPEAIVVAGRCGAVIRETPVAMRDRLGGVSSINPGRAVYYMIKVTLAILVANLTAVTGGYRD